MKTIVFMLISIVLCSFTGKVNNTLSEDNLKGRVKSITEYEVVIVKGKEMYPRKQVYSFDSNGNRVLIRSYDVHDSIDFPDFKSAYKYNARGNKIEEIIYNQDGTVSWKTTYSYDNNGFATEAKRCHGNGDIEERYGYMYDAQGNKIGRISYNAKGETNCKSTYKYDEHNNLIEEVEDCSYIPWLKDGVCVKTTREYNSGNEVAYLEHDRANNILIKSINNIEAFDNMGNWIKQTSIHKRDGFESPDTIITKREITYY